MQWPVLTRKEKQVIAFVLFCFFLGLATKAYRDGHSATAPAENKKAVPHAQTNR